MEEIPPSDKSLLPVPPMPENASITPIEKAKKTIWISIFEMVGLSKLGEHLHEEKESVKKVPLIIVLCLFVGIGLRGCWDDSKLETAQDDLAKSNGAKAEAERDRDKYQTLFNQDENTVGPLRQIANAKFAASPPDQRVDLLLQKMSNLQSDIDSKIQSVSPVNQNIAVAVAEITIRWRSEAPAPTATTPTPLPNVTGIAFGSGNTAILVAAGGSGIHMVTTNSGPGWAGQSTSFELAPDSPSGFPISKLKEAQFIQIEMSVPNVYILEGRVKWTINNNTVLNFDVPAGPSVDTHVFIRNLSEGFKPLL